MRKLMMLAATLAVAMLAASPALAQDDPAVIADAKAKEAKAGGAFAEAECKDGYIVSKAGGVVAKAPCEPEPPKAPPPPPPKAAPPPPPAPAPAPPPPPKELPKSGGSSTASLFALGAGALLVGGGLLARRFIR
ncbi:MAG: LPXTG cell wall anchor domain-containing protein [Actinomycetota bacterium]|nr:LPXTG cell wall anchor domain-containing protein [Actinomycetota bacterium]